MDTLVVPPDSLICSFSSQLRPFPVKAALKTLEPKWLEQFDMHMYDDQSHTLEVMVFDRRKDLFMGRCTVDLSQLEREITHHKWRELEDGAGQIFFLITISGTSSSATVSDFKLSDLKPLDCRAIHERYVRIFDWL